LIADVEIRECDDKILTPADNIDLTDKIGRASPLDEIIQIWPLGSVTNVIVIFTKTKPYAKFRYKLISGALFRRADVSCNEN